MLGLDYGSGSDGEETGDKSESTASHLQPLDEGKTIVSIQKSIKLNSAPVVASKEEIQVVKALDITCREVKFNPTYEQLFSPSVGPENPYKTKQDKAPKNTLAGYVEPAHINAFQFENQRRTFQSFGYALDPSISDVSAGGLSIIGDLSTAADKKGTTVFESDLKRPGDKRVREKANDPSDIEGFQGPWSCYVDEKKVSKPSEEMQVELDEITAKRNKRGKVTDDKPAEEKATIHIKDAYDYQGRSFLYVPQDEGLNLKSDEPPQKCFLPKKQIHTWTGHTKGISAIKLFPQSGHLLLSCGMDSKIKLWEVYRGRRCVCTYTGHKQAVRDITFNNNGTQFLSASYDRYVKQWDTETGQCINRYTTRKVPYCVKFHPSEDKQHLFVAGMSDKKIICWDTRSSEIIQEYDRHLGAVNTVSFIDENRRFVTTSDDKSLRVWEWDIPVDFKYIADPTMHSMPFTTISPNNKWLACQSMDNQIIIFNALNKCRMNRKKVFKGHMVAGYACGIDFSPDMSYVISGDADGKLYVWDWKTTKLFSKFKAHDDVCIACLWLPHETSKIITAGWDGLLKLWD